MTPNQYITENYDDIKSWLYNITKGEKPHLFDDFIHEVIIIFLQHEKSQDSIDTGTSRFFLVRIGLNQWRSSTSPFHYQYRDSFLDTPDYEPVTEEYDISGDVMEKLALEGINEMYELGGGERYEAIIIMMYFANGANYSELGRQLGMKHTTIRKIYLRGIEKLKFIIQDRINRLKYGNTELTTDFTTILSEWDIMGSNNQQRTLLLVDEIFKNGYFKVA